MQNRFSPRVFSPFLSRPASFVISWNMPSPSHALHPGQPRHRTPCTLQRQHPPHGARPYASICTIPAPYPHHIRTIHAPYMHYTCNHDATTMQHHASPQYSSCVPGQGIPTTSASILHSSPASTSLNPGSSSSVLPPYTRQCIVKSMMLPSTASLPA